MSSRSLILNATAALIVALAGAANAQSIAGFTASKNAGNGGDNFMDGLTESFERKSTVAVLSSSTLDARSRYQSITATDSGFATSASNSLSSDYSAAFNIVAPGAYILHVSTSLSGAFTLVDDGDSSGHANANGVNGTQTGGTVETGSLSLGDPGQLDSNGGGNTGFNPTASANIGGLSNGTAKPHSLRFTWSTSCSSDSGFTGGDECAVRLGIAVSYGGETAGDYPGSGSRTAANDGHFVHVVLESLCGNGTIEGSRGEQCDDSALNGTTASCCTSTCQLRPAGTVCRAVAGSCDLQEVCNGSTGACPTNAVKVAGTICRAAAGVCDLAEVCNGTSELCPADTKSTAICRAATDLCDAAEACDGVANTCPVDVLRPAGAICRLLAGGCDLVDTCTGTTAACTDAKQPASFTCRPSFGDCDAAENCSGTTNDCPADAKSTAVCRPVAGICDEAESCNGIANDCPADVFLGSQSGAFICRPSAGACDVPEACNGSGITCPVDGVVPAASICRASTGVCDPFELCDGVGTACPPDALSPAGTVCRAAAGVCDIVETCTGASSACPADGLRPASFVCRAAGGVCDLVENCSGSSPVCPADAKSTAPCRASAGICDVVETCDGASNACPTDAFQPAATVCRGAGGVCDNAEQCTGSSAACPSDAKSTALCRSAAGVCDHEDYCDGASNNCADSVSGAFVVCRASTGICDPAELCDGTNAPCPADTLTSIGTVCRAAGGVCDVAELCDGLTGPCPADTLVSAGTTCRASTGACDPVEACNGSAVVCPADLLAPATTICRAAVDGCDIAENCTGASAACPTDQVRPDGDTDTVCDASDNCPVTANPAQTDTDGDLLGDACDICTGGAITTSTKLTIAKLVTPPGDDKIKLRGKMLVPTTPAFDPTHKGARLLVTDSAGGVVVDALLPAGAFDPFFKAGWKQNSVGTNFKYQNKGQPEPLVSGITKVGIRHSTSVPGTIKFVVAGKTGSYPVIGANLPLRATLVIEGALGVNGQCGDALFPGPAPAPACTFSGPTVRCK